MTARISSEVRLCEMCGVSRLNSHNKIGVCRKNPECKKAASYLG